MHVGIIGTGYVGLVTGACFAEFGVFVTCIDKDKDKIKSLKKGKIPFYEPGLDELVKRNVQQGRLTFTTKTDKAVKSSLVLFIAVGTPRRGDGAADMRYVEAVAKEIAANMDDYKVIVTKSTVPVGTGKKIEAIIAKTLKEKFDFDMVSNPEFLREGSAIEDFMRPNRVVIGANNPHAIAIMKDLYKPLYLIETPFVITNIETAELIKYASNAFLATKISFINEVANLCEKIGADVHMVAKGMGLDKRIGPKFLHPGPGYGGSCLPKDTNALLKMSEENHEKLSIVDAVVKVNERQKKRVIEKMHDAMGSVRGKTIAVLGLSFKPNTDDIRESPAIDIIGRLISDEANVKAYDPQAMNNMKKVFGGIEYCDSAEKAIEGADAVVVLTDWDEFKYIKLDVFADKMKGNVLVDGRNMYDVAALSKRGMTCFNLGRI